MKFYASIATHYDEIFPLSPAQLAVAESLLSPGDRILDVGCATGSLASALADRGHVVLGIDLDSQLIALAKKRLSDKPNDQLTFEQADMLQVGKLYPENPSQLVVTVGNTLVHLSREDIKAFLHGVHDHLNPGGHLLIQIINYDRIIKDNVDKLPTIDNETMTFVRKYDLSLLPEGIHFQTTLKIHKTGETIENNIPLTPLRASELSSMLEEAGFAISAMYGNFKREPHSESSYALVVIAKKPSSP